MTIDMIEPVETDSTQPDEARSSLALVQTTLTEFDKVEAGIAELERKYKGVVYPVITAKGMREAKAARAEIREPRYAVQNTAKDAKKPLNDLKRNIDARAEYIRSRLLAIEEPIDQQITAQEEREAAEKARREQIDRERRAAIEAIRSCVTRYVMSGSAEISRAIAELEATDISAGAWGELELTAKRAITETIDALVQLGSAAIEREEAAAQAKAEAERLEAERIAREQAEAQARAHREAEEAAARAAQEEEDALVASILAMPSRIEGPRVGYVERVINTFNTIRPDWESDPRSRVRAAIETVAEQLNERLAAAREHERIASERAEIERQRAEIAERERKVREAEAAAERERQAEAQRLADEEAARVAEAERIAAEERAASEAKAAEEAAATAQPVESVSITPADYDEPPEHTVTVKWAGGYLDIHYRCGTTELTGVTTHQPTFFPADAFTDEQCEDFAEALKDELQALADAAQEDERDR